MKPSKTLLSELKNFGPVTLPELESIGLKHLEDLQRLGFEASCRKWVQHFPERLNANAFLAVLATLEGVLWTKASESMRREARALAQEMRAEK